MHLVTHNALTPQKVLNLEIETSLSAQIELATKRSLPFLVLHGDLQLYLTFGTASRNHDPPRCWYLPLQPTYILLKGLSYLKGSRNPLIVAVAPSLRLDPVTTFAECRAIVLGLCVSSRTFQRDTIRKPDENQTSPLLAKPAV